MTVIPSFPRRRSFDVETQQWKSLANMPTARMDRFVLVAGEHLDGSENLPTVEVLDMVGNVWRPLPNMTSSQEGCEVYAAVDHVSAVGGRDDETFASIGRVALLEGKEKGLFGFCACP